MAQLKDTVVNGYLYVNGIFKADQMQFNEITVGSNNSSVKEDRVYLNDGLSTGYVGFYGAGSSKVFQVAAANNDSSKIPVIIKSNDKTLTLLDGDGNTISTGTVTANIFKSTVANGTAPLIVTSKTVVENLNADTLDGLHADDIKSTRTVIGTDTTITADSFVYDSATGMYLYQIANTDIKATQIPTVIFSRSTLEIASNAEIYPDTVAGYINLYAKSVPSGDITISYAGYYDI